MINQATPLIVVDFNARTEEGYVRLDTRGAKKSLENVTIKKGQAVLLTDGELVSAGEIIVKDDCFYVKIYTLTIRKNTVRRIFEALSHIFRTLIRLFKQLIKISA